MARTALKRGAVRLQPAEVNQVVGALAREVRAAVFRRELVAAIDERGAGGSHQAHVGFSRAVELDPLGLLAALEPPRIGRRVGENLRRMAVGADVVHHSGRGVVRIARQVAVRQRRHVERVLLVRDQEAIVLSPSA